MNDIIKIAIYVLIGLFVFNTVFGDSSGDSSLIDVTDSNKIIIQFQNLLNVIVDNSSNIDSYNQTILTPESK